MGKWFGFEKTETIAKDLGKITLEFTHHERSLKSKYTVEVYGRYSCFGSELFTMSAEDVVRFTLDEKHLKCTDGTIIYPVSGAFSCRIIKREPYIVKFDKGYDKFLGIRNNTAYREVAE